MAEWQLWVFKIWSIPLNTRTTLNNSTSLCTMIEKQTKVFKKNSNNSTSLCRVAELQKLIFEQPNKGTLNNLTNYNHFAHWQSEQCTWTWHSWRNDKSRFCNKSGLNRICDDLRLPRKQVDGGEQRISPLWPSRSTIHAICVLFVCTFNCSFGFSEPKWKTCL